MRELLPFVIAGLATGSVYGLAGIGLVLTYKTSGIFNFAHGALATAGAYVFYTLFVEAHLPTWPSAITAVVVLGAILGLGFERLAKGLSGASVALRITATVGVLLVIQAVAVIAYGSDTRLFPAILPTSSVEMFGVSIAVSDLVTMGIALAATIGFYVFFRVSRLGTAMRAVVDNPELLDLTGTSPTAVRRWAWVIGCCFATLSGLLLAPSLDLNASLITLLVLQAFAAAAIGLFSSLPLTYVGGLVIGVGASVLTKYVSSTSILSGLPASLPFIVLFVVLLLVPRRRLAEPPFTTPRPRIEMSMRPGAQLGAAGILLALLIALPPLVGFELSNFTSALTFLVLFLSLGLLVRNAGQVSLCQAAFSAIGAAAFSHLMVDTGVPWLAALLLGGLIAIPVGAVLAVPAIRHSGLYLALATLGFGFLLQSMFYNTNVMFGTTQLGIAMPRPHLSWLDISNSKGYYYVVLAIVVISSVLVVTLTRTRFGRLLRALGDSPLALSTNGASVVTMQVLAFCISAFLAGIAGILYSTMLTTENGSSYDPFTALTYLALVVIVVGSAPWYAVLACAGIALIPAYVDVANINNYLQLVFGASAVAVALRPRGHGAPEWLRSTLSRAGLLRPPPPARAASVPEPVDAGEPPAAAADLPEGELEVREVTVRYGGLTAVSSVNLVARSGRTTGLIGPNGAGKTTLFNACCGLVRASSGRVLWDGRDITRWSPAARARRGLGRTFQRTELMDSLSVAENIAMGREASMAGGNLFRQVVSRRSEREEIRRAVDDAITLCQLEDLREVPVGMLPTGQRRLVEVARCLAGHYSVILLDEPSAGLDGAERARLESVLREVTARRGVGFLLVEHDMSLVMSICDYIYVLDFGQLIFEGTPPEVNGADEVRSAYLGETDAMAEPAR